MRENFLLGESECFGGGGLTGRPTLDRTGGWQPSFSSRGACAGQGMAAHTENRKHSVAGGGGRKGQQEMKREVGSDLGVLQQCLHRKFMSNPNLGKLCILRREQKCKPYFFP